MQLNGELTVREDDSIVTQRVTVGWVAGDIVRRSYDGDYGTSDHDVWLALRTSEPRFFGRDCG